MYWSTNLAPDGGHLTVKGVSLNKASLRVLCAVLGLMPRQCAAEVGAPSWVLETKDAGWQPRDSAGEVVFDDHFWVLGGWFNSFEAPPRDVWRSRDGRAWECVTRQAPWNYSDLGMSLAFQDKMWFLGGWYNGRLPGCGATSQVWSSTDGAVWDRVAEHAGWSPRLASAVVVFKNKMWVLGGTENYYFGDERSVKNDVWNSDDGKNWTLATEHAGWSPRAYHQAVVHGDRIFVMGGGNYVPQYQALNDVWCSSDGITWERVCESAPWHPRIWFSAAVYRDHMWVLGGWSNNPSKNWGDVWYSADGRTWQPLQSTTVWKERHEHCVYVKDDKLWVAGGHAQPLNNEVWSLSLPSTWPGGR